MCIYIDFNIYHVDTQLQQQCVIANNVCKLICSLFSFFVHWGPINHLSGISLSLITLLDQIKYEYKVQMGFEVIINTAS